MAVGLDFLSKTKLGGMKDVMGAGAAKTSSPKQSTNVSSALAGQDSQKAGKAKGTDVADMQTSDLLKYVYNNQGKPEDTSKIKLPYKVEYGNEDFAVNGKNFDEMVKEISKQTHDSTSKIESELKKKYGNNAKGGSLNMQA